MKKASICSVFLLVLHLLNCSFCFAGNHHVNSGLSDNLFDKVDAQIVFDVHPDQYYTLTHSTPTFTKILEISIDNDWICHTTVASLSSNILFLNYLKNSIIFREFSTQILFKLYPFHFFF